jgi:IS30 family transposase
MPDTRDSAALRNRARLIRLQEGLSARAIAARLGVPRATVGDWIKGIGETRHDYQCGRCGQHTYRLRSHARYCCDKGRRTQASRPRANNPPRPRQPRRYRRPPAVRPRITARERALAVAMRHAGFTLAEIAEHFARSPMGIHYMLKREGVDDLTTDRRFRHAPGAA